MKIRNLRLGATDRWPRGKADVYDEGELRMAVGIDFQQAIVRLEFGKTVTWLGLPSVEARQLAALLISKADELDKRRT